MDLNNIDEARALINSWDELNRFKNKLKDLVETSTIDDHLILGDDNVGNLDLATAEGSATCRCIREIKDCSLDVVIKHIRAIEVKLKKL